MDFWHVTNQGEGKIEKENSQPTLALDLHFTISRLPEKNLRWFWKPLLLIFQRTRCCVQIAKWLFWRGKWNLCGWRSSKLLKIARVTGGLAAQLGRNRRHWRWREKAVACSNIFPSTDLPSETFIQLFTQRKSKTVSLIEATHPPRGVPLFLSSLVTGRVRVTYVCWLQLTLKTVVTVFQTAEHCKALVAQKKGMTKKTSSQSLVDAIEKQ